MKLCLSDYDAFVRRTYMEDGKLVKMDELLIDGDFIETLDRIVHIFHIQSKTAAMPPNLTKAFKKLFETEDSE